MITKAAKSANYDTENIKFFHNLSFIFQCRYACALLTRSPKRNKRKVVSGSRVTLPVNFACKPGLSFNPLARVTLAVGLPYLACKPGLSFNPLARVTLAVGLPYLLVNRALAISHCCFAEHCKEMYKDFYIIAKSMRAL